MSSKSIAHDNHQKERTANPVAALAEFKSAFVSAGLISLVINVLLLASPLFMLQIYDRVLASRSLPTLVTLLALVAATFAFVCLLEILRMRLMARIAAQFSKNLGPACFTSVVDHALQRPQLQPQSLRDLETIRQYISGPGPSAFFDMPWVPIYLLLAYLLHPWLGVMTTAAAIVLFALAIANDWVTKKAGGEGAKHAQSALAIADETRRGAEVLRVMGSESHIRGRWQREHQEAVDYHIHYADQSSPFAAGTKMLRLFLQSAVLALGAALAIEGEVSAGTIIAASIIMSRALAPVEQATGQWNLFQGVRRSFARLRDTLGALPPHHEPMPLPAPKGRVEIESLVVGAPGMRKPILEGLSFALEPGDALGVIGSSGSGKSTLARAIVGVWPLMAGTVRLDGASTDQWPRSQFASAVGYVPQDVELFSGTVAENVARFDPAADPKAIVTAAQRANVHEMILQLPDGYQTQLGEGGASLSAGQRQRIALARALFANPVLLVLDEPNSNLDTSGEIALSEALLDARKSGVTVILISHRPSSLSVVNKLLLIKEGRQAAFGSRDDVLKTMRPTPVPTQPRTVPRECVQ